MDEPLSNLDAKLRNEMRAEIIKLRQRINTTFVYVTHDQTEAMTLGDRIVIMKDGFIQQIGTPQEVFDHPANLFVAGFIGTPQMNLFDAKLVKNGEKYAVAIGGVTEGEQEIAGRLEEQGLREGVEDDVSEERREQDVAGDVFEDNALAVLEDDFTSAVHLEEREEDDDEAHVLDRGIGSSAE